MMCIYKHCFPPMLLVFSMKCAKMPCPLPHNHYLLLLTFFTYMLASLAHLYMPHLFTHCLPTIICVMLMSIAFFSIFDICYISLWLHFGLFVYIFLSDCMCFDCTECIYWLMNRVCNVVRACGTLLWSIADVSAYLYAASSFLPDKKLSWRNLTAVNQGSRLAFLTPNFTNLAFLEAVGVKKIVWFLAFSFQYYLAFFGGSSHILSDWSFGF